MTKSMPRRITSKHLESDTWRLGMRIRQNLELRHNMAQRLAIFVVNGDMLTPGYLSNRELYCWICGVWLRYDQKELFDGS
jgi:hypothetical protein